MMHFSKIFYNKYLYIELYRDEGSYITGVNFCMKPCKISFCVFILGLTFIKDILE